MVNINASAGADNYRARRTNRPGMCLWETQNNGYRAPASIGTYAGQYPTAYSAWKHDATGSARHTDAHPPKGAAVYFGPSPTRTDANRNAGDVVISLGPDSKGVYWVMCSDGGGSGIMARMTIAARARQIARPYLGWTTNYLGHKLTNLGTAEGVGSTVDLITSSFATKELGSANIKKLQAQLHIAQTGTWDNATEVAVQKKIGTVADGLFGGNSIGKLQTFLGIKSDKLWGDATTIAFKHAIDASKFGTPIVVPTAPTQAQFDAVVKERDAAKTQLAAATTSLAAATTKIKTAQTSAAATVKALA